jgi:hypothetical protein
MGRGKPMLDEEKLLEEHEANLTEPTRIEEA